MEALADKAGASVPAPAARRHPITGYPLEQGHTDHSLTDEQAQALHGAASGRPPSDDRQAAEHYKLMIGELHKLCQHHSAEGDADGRSARAPRLYPAFLPPDPYDSTASRRRY